MSPETASPFLTKRQFYSSMMIVWLYIMIVLGDLWRITERWTTGLLWGAAFLSLMAYFVMMISNRKPRPAGELPPVSDRVKEIANDPARKIEAIKVYREETGAGLADAKDAVETYISGR